MRTLLALAALVLTATNAAASSANSAAAVCPFCDAPTLVLAEQIQMCDHLLLGRYLGGTKATDVTGGSTRFEILEIGFSLGNRFQKGQVVELPVYYGGNKDGKYTLMGPNDRLEDWHAPSEVTDTGWTYQAKMPKLVTDTKEQSQRLLYFVPYFEHPDQMVANDAFAEFAAAPYSVIVPLKDQLPREKILQWLVDEKTPVNRIGFYGLMAGLCGKPEDAPVLEKKILVLDADFRLGIEGVMAGYLLLKGEDGLKVLEDAKMRSKVAMDKNGKEINLPFSETYAVMQALRFMWTYEPDRIPKDRLKQSMHILLDRQELADLVITDLARWKDWSVQDRLVALYDDQEFAIPAIRRAIIRYLITCSQDKGPKNADGTQETPEFALKAEQQLKVIEEKDPKTFADAKRFLVR